MIMWSQLQMAGNAVIAIAYMCIAVLIIVPLVRQHQFGSNKLGTATAAIFFSCSVGHGLHTFEPAAVAGLTPTLHSTGTWWLALWQILTAIVAVYYLSLRRFYGRLLTAAPLFDDLGEQERLRDLEAFQAEVKARSAAEVDRDFYAAMLKSINQNSSSLIYVKDLDGRYLMVNSAVERSFDVAEGALIGLTDEDIDPQLAPLWREADLKAHDGPYRIEEYNDHQTGRRYFDSMKFPLLDGKGVMYATCGISTDITEQKLVNLELAEARDAALAATAAKSAFLATMSHEIRTPMNAVIGMTDLLLDTDLDEHQQEFLDTVRSSGDALLGVINDILDFSKIEAGELRLVLEPFALGDEVEGALDMVAAAADTKDIDLVCFVDDSCPRRVLGDAPHLRQIVVNLLSNSVKFTDVGEVLVTVSAELSTGGRHWVTIQVTDTGIGMSPEGVSKLFRSFSQVDASPTRAYGGTGLGLAISQRLARAMGGDITVTSTESEGSTFTVTLLLDPCADVEEEATPEPDPALAGVSVLIVDDNATNLRMLDLQLSSLDMACSTAATPGDALGLVSGGLRCDVAVLDMNMPEMDGAALADELRALPGFGATPIILLTNMGARPSQGDHGFAAILAKPVKNSVLRSALTSVLSGSVDTSQQGLTRRQTLDRANQPLRVLLAEDNPVNQRVAQLMLDKLGHHVDIVSNGRAAVDAVTTVPYDVVLMDVQMPQMDGLEATRAIRSHLPAEQQPHIIAMTASALVEDQEACSNAGMESYLTKPVRVHELKSMLNRVSATIRTAPAPVQGGPAQHPLPAPEPAEQAAPCVDTTVLDRLTEDLMDDDGSMVDELIEKFLGTAGATTSALSEASSIGDAAAVGRLAHTLASSSELLGAQRLAALLRKTQELAQEAPEELPVVAEQVQSEYARVADALARRPAARRSKAAGDPPAQR
ncbi:MAG TPA: response regulator [Propionibacteriaceae bacterium]